MERKPPCFEDQDQWADWNFYAATSAHLDDNYCVDCLPEFKAKMCLQGKCEHPETSFIKMRDSTGVSVVGISNRSRWWGKLNKGLKKFEHDN